MNFLEILLVFIKKIFFIDTENSLAKSTMNYNSFTKKEYLLTPTELKFYKVLKEITDELNLIICPQVSLYEIVKSNNYKEFNKISRKTIDFVITEQNLKIRCCIELDDYTHNRQTRIERDNFLNSLFENIGIKLYRIQVNQYYEKNTIKEKIMNS